MQHRITTLCKHLVVPALCLGLWFTPSFAANAAETPQIADQTFSLKPKLAVPFEHDAHNAKANLKECGVCHHSYVNGERVASGLGDTTKRCSDCHQERPASNNPAPSLVTAYHKLCQGCHQAKGKGPVACSQCHKKGSAAAGN